MIPFPRPLPSDSTQQLPRLFIHTMAEPLGRTSDLGSLSTFAFHASVALYTTVNSYNAHQQRVRDLVKETSALSGVLGSLTEAISASADLDLTALLEIPLRRCGAACEEFEEEVRRCALHSGGSRAGPPDWARVRYMGEDIDGFRRVLSGYRLTVTIALSDANL